MRWSSLCDLQHIAKSFDLQKKGKIGHVKYSKVNPILTQYFTLLDYSTRSSYKTPFQNNPSKTKSPASHCQNQRRTRGGPACRERAPEEAEETILQQEVIALHRIAITSKQASWHCAYTHPKDQLYAFCHSARRRKTLSKKIRSPPLLSGGSSSSNGKCCALLSSKLHTIIYFLKVPCIINASLRKTKLNIV